MSNKKLYEIVKQDLIKRHGDYDVLGEEEDILDFMILAMSCVGMNNQFKSFTEWLLYLGLSDEDIMWVYTNLEKELK